MGIPLRWVVLIVVALSSALNYLTRQTLPALAPVLRSEFDLSNADYGFLLSAFSIAYAVSAPLAGWFIDRVGLNRGIIIAVTLWSLLGAGTGLVYGFLGLLFLRLCPLRDISTGRGVSQNHRLSEGLSPPRSSDDPE